MFKTKFLLRRSGATEGREIILHIGDFKTGSTALQSWLVAQGRGHGIAPYPNPPHVDLAQTRDPKALLAAWRRFARFVRHAKAPFVVASAEHFEMSDPDLVFAAAQRALPGWSGRIRVIGYVRPHLRSFPSRYAESVKIGSCLESPDAYLASDAVRRRIEAHARLSRWEALWGERFSLGLFERSALTGGDIRRDFVARVIGRDPGELPGATGRENVALGQQGLAAALFLHRQIGALPKGIQTAARFSVGRELGRVMERDAKWFDPPFELGRDLGARMIEMFDADARAIDARWFDGTPMQDALRLPAQASRQTSDVEPERVLAPEARDALRVMARLLRKGLTDETRARRLNGVFLEHV